MRCPLMSNNQDVEFESQLKHFTNPSLGSSFWRSGWSVSLLAWGHRTGAGSASLGGLCSLAWQVIGVVAFPCQHS